MFMKKCGFSHFGRVQRCWDSGIYLVKMNNNRSLSLQENLISPGHNWGLSWQELVYVSFFRHLLFLNQFAAQYPLMVSEHSCTRGKGGHTHSSYVFAVCTHWGRSQWVMRTLNRWMIFSFRYTAFMLDEAWFATLKCLGFVGLQICGHDCSAVRITAGVQHGWRVLLWMGCLFL